MISYYGTAARDAWNPFANSTDNNGNVLRQLHYVPLSGGGYVLPQLDDYTYDELNRIKSVTEAQLNSSGGWTFNLFTQNFNYDRWGNRTVSCSPCQPGVTGDVFTIDTATNRITAKNGTGMTYDSAGNQTYDATGNRWFDGENRMHKATQGGTTSHYVYDADGKRVRRIIGSTETWMIYGIDGELVGEYAAAASATSPQKEYGYRSGQMLIAAETSPLKITWLVTDHLGSPRMNIRGTGTDGGSLASVTRHDYLPFGEEQIAGIRVNGGSGQYGYEPPPDGVRQKFTGKERDTETGLDFFGARYFASVQGRFTSVDPLLSSGTIYDPQSWNRYSYTLNNPLKYTDPFGLYVFADGTDDEYKKKFRQGLKDLKSARDSFNKKSDEYKRLDRALNAYGKEGVDNGVTVRFGATANGAPAHAIPGLKPADANGMKTVTADNPTGQDITVTFDPAQHNDALAYATSVGHEGSHVADISAVVAALPNNLLDPAAQAVLNGPLNLTSYATEKAAYEVTSFIAQARMTAGPNETKFLTMGAGNHEIWNTGWSAADRATKRAVGIDRVLAEPKSQGGRYEVTPKSPGPKLF